MNRNLVRVIQGALTLGFIAWVFRDPAMIARTIPVITQANQSWLLFGLFLAGVDQVFNIVRWYLYLKVQGVNPGWKVVTRTFMAGLFFNLLLPGMVSGDVVKIALLGTAVGGRWTAITLSVIADRLIGLLALVLVSLVVAIGRHEWLSQTPATRGLFIFLVIFAVASGVGLAGSFILTGLNAFNYLPRWVPFREKIVGLGEAWHLFIKEWRVSLVAFLLSFPVLFTFFGVFWSAGHAFGAHLHIVDICSIMPVITIISSIPISFSGLGVREELFKILLKDLSNVPNEVAVLTSLGGYALYAVWSAAGLLFCHSQIPQVMELLKKPFQPLSRLGKHETGPPPEVPH